MKLVIPAAVNKALMLRAVFAETGQRAAKMVKRPKLSIVEVFLLEGINNADGLLRIRSGILLDHLGMLTQLDSRYNLPMSRWAAELLEEVRQLPPSEFEWLIGEFLQEGDGSSDAEIDASWKAEVERRVAEVDAGTAVTYSWEEVEAPLRARLAR